MNNPNKKRLRRTMMFLNAQKPGLIKDQIGRASCRERV